MNLQVYINDQLVDLSDDSPLALTFQINNLAEVKNQQGNTSNQFKLPLTQRNRTILGYPDEIAFCTDAPYTQYPARIIQDGMEIVPNAVAELNSIEQDTANVTILSGNVDFFDAIDGKIYDMGNIATTYGANTPFKPYDHAWTIDNVAISQTKTEGWIWPIVDYGKIETDVTKPIDVRYLRPGFFLKTAIEVMVGNAGFKATGSLIANALYQKLIVQFANDNFQHSTDMQNARDSYSISVQKTSDQFCAESNSDSFANGTVTFSQINADPSHAFTANTFVAPINMAVTIEFNYDLRVRGTRKNHSAGIHVFIRTAVLNTVTDLATNNHNADQPVNVYAVYNKQKLSCDVNLVKNQRVIIGYNLPLKGSEAYVNKGALFTITNKQADVIYGQTIQCERIFPDISQKDLLKDTLQHFGVICQTDNTTKTVNFAFFKDIVNNIPIAYDWTGKCLDQGKTITFQLGGYAQVNYMKYKQDDNVLPNGFADSQINIADATLPATADLFESQFAPTLNRPWIGGTIAQINKVDQSDPNNTDFSVSTQPRILINDTRFVNTPVTFTDGSGKTRVLNNDYVSVPYFYRQGGEESLLFNELRLKYYPDLERILKQSKKVIRYFLLTPRDVLELDLLIPVYLQQDSCYYYINKVDSWQKGQPTKVELVKLG
ncbi:hypothetical protein [Mucilaginibacter polytrichastri]|uniref:DUF4815 domain-containing protein n=1 Tax=Mucilaginibacter polytrichastri TaxID=1302689 RepID=A0A1Q5ZSV0_9SPHI|nr:hypothetical protein [Mucilaginibacter polytrichastri]OKS84849.1 hypothetical protein RG47T_0286 [Mucilaginibacter polytrichastri]SFS48679.1 hypothetical protein SAMN04487890_101788 [Mucilaginibacter polytrichastri]